MVFRELIFNVMLLLSLGILYGLLVRRWRGGEISARIIAGCLFGGIAIAGMILPLHSAPGVIIDGRSIVISLSGLFGGPLTAAVAALLASGYRISVGGVGALAGVGIIMTSAGLGVAYYYLRLRKPRAFNPLCLLGFGLLVNLLMLLWMFTLSDDLPLKVLNLITLPVLLVFPAGTLFLGILLHDQEAGLKVKEEVRRLSRIVESTPVAIVLADLKGTIKYANPSLLAIGGFLSAKDIIGRPIFAFTDQDGIKRLREEVIPTLLTGESWRGDIAMQRKDGSYYTSELSASLITDRDGQPEFILTSLIDITDRRRTEKSLEESERRYRRITESAISYIFTIFLEDGKPVRAVYSPTCLTMTGYTPEELEADINLWQEMALEEYREIIREQFSRLFSGDTIKEVEYRIKRKDGEIRWVSAAITPTYGDSEILVSYDGIIRDITDRKLVEEVLEEHRAHLQESIKKRTSELEEKVRQGDLLNRGMVNLMEDSRAVQHTLENTAQALKDANAELETFAYSAAHDLKAPLRAIEGYIEAVLDDYGDRLEEEGRDYAGRITGVCRRMAGLIDDLLSYSRLSQSEIRVKPIELSLVIDQALGDLEHRITETKSRVDLEDPFPMVLANRAILLQVAKNLISNAVMFVAPGVLPRLSIRTQTKNGMVRIIVEDNGIGIKEDDRGRVYQVFERLHGIETYPGTGIGLAIVRRGVEKMGGWVGFESELGKGSRFWIELPGVKKDG